MLGAFSKSPNKDSFNEGTKLQLEPPKYTFLDDTTVINKGVVHGILFLSYDKIIMGKKILVPCLDIIMISFF